MVWCHKMLLVQLIYVCTIINLCKSWVILVDSYAEECFYEKVDKGTKLSLTFQVTEGGFLDIDVTIFGPDRREIYIGTRETNGKYTFSAYEDGKYQFCFSNKMSTVTPKKMMFDVSVGDVADWQHNSEDTSNSSVALMTAVVELSRGLWGINGEQEYIIARMDMHRRIDEHTNGIVVRWCVFEVLIIVTGMCFEIWYIKRFFEVRRVV